MRLFPERFGLLPYVYLIYLVLPLVGLVDEQGLKGVAGYALLLLFLLSYRQLFWFPPFNRFFFWLSMQMVIIGIFSLWHNSYNLLMGFFTANFIGWLDEGKQFRRALSTFIIVLIGMMMLLGLRDSMLDLLYLLPFIVVMLLTPFGVRSMNQRMELEKQLDQAHEQIKELIQREERLRIARDLHDTLGHTLTLITLQSQLVQRLIEKEPKQAQEEAKEIETIARTALSEVRQLVSEMRAHTLGEGLAELERILTAAGITFNKEGIADFSQLLPLQQNILAMCLREAGTNIVKHSGAQHCVVTCEESKGYFSVIVRDDGVGLSEQSKMGNGLQGMKERLSLLEGRLEWKGERGTIVRMTVPMILKSEEIV